MANTVGVTASAGQYVYMKQRISKAHGQAKCIGLVYLLATVAFAVLACLPLLELPAEVGLKLSVKEFWKPFKQIKQFKTQVPTFLVAGFYGAMLLGLVVNVFRSLSKLGWLFKRRASRVYGFNRNMYAMDDMGRIFSGSLSCFTSFSFLIFLVGRSSVKPDMLFYVLLGAGVFVHLVFGVWSGNVSLFEMNDGIIEQKREVGNFAPILRNLLQLAAVAAAIFFFLKVSVLGAMAADPVWAKGMAGVKEAIASFKAQPKETVVMGAHLLIAVLLLCMIAYATGTKEFDPDGAEAPGRKCNLFLSFLVAGLAAFLYFYFKEMATIASLDHKYMLFLAIAAGVMFVLELCLICLPRVPWTDSDDVDEEKYLKQTYAKSGVYLPVPVPMPRPLPQYAPQPAEKARKTAKRGNEEQPVQGVGEYDPFAETEND